VRVENILAKAENLTKLFKTGRREIRKAVDGISLEVHEGETLGLVGESGSGKSTTAMMMARLLEPSAGRILYRGEDVSKLKGAQKKRARKQIQYVFQDPLSALNPRHKVKTLLEEPLAIFKIGSRTERMEMVEEMLAQIGLSSNYMNSYVHQLSGGQRQRIGIARALMIQPEFLILDEPVSALDVSLQAQILNLLKRLQKQFDLTYLFVSHDLNVVHYMCDRIAVMYLGEIVEVQKSEDLFANPQHPYTKMLLGSMLDISHDTQANLQLAEV